MDWRWNVRLRRGQLGARHVKDSNRTTRKSRQIGLAVAALVVSLAILEAGFFVISLFLPNSFDYVPPTRERFERYLAYSAQHSHVSSGWLPNAELTAPAGYRLSPAGADYAAPCLSLYGDSFTWGFRVTDSEAWGDLLTKSLGCRVDNYGVAGYGTDQAYLRFVDNEADEAPVAVLSVWSENIARNVNQDRSLMYLNFGIKPRFILDESGQLELIPPPSLTLQNYEQYADDPGAFLKHEFFLPEQTPLSKRRLGFPYLIRLPYFFSYKRIYLSLLALISNPPSWYSELYEADHPSQALPIMIEVLTAFDRLARERGKRPIVFVLPSIKDADHWRATGTWSYKPLLDALQEREIQTFNVGAEMTARMGEEDYCVYMCRNRAHRSGHFTVEGNRLLGEIAHDLLRAEGIGGESLASEPDSAQSNPD